MNLKSYGRNLWYKVKSQSIGICNCLEYGINLKGLEQTISIEIDYYLGMRIYEKPDELNSTVFFKRFSMLTH